MSRNDSSGYSKMCWSIGDVVDNTRVKGLCKTAFCNVYRVSSSHVDNIVIAIKGGVANSLKPFSDRSQVDPLMLKDLRRIAKSLGFYLTQKQVAAAKLPNSPTVLTAYGWMGDFFNLVGDTAPNCNDEIHLEPTYIVEVYGEYFQDLTSAGMDCVSVDTFASIWSNCFDHVKIREFKAVSGKCQCCANLSTMRKTFKSHRDREYVTMMHALHRSTYMGERIAYAERRNKVSIIQNNCTKYKLFIHHAYIIHTCSSSSSSSSCSSCSSRSSSSSSSSISSSGSSSSSRSSNSSSCCRS